MDTELALYIAWPVVGAIGALLLRRKGYFADGRAQDRGTRTVPAAAAGHRVGHP